MSSLNLNRLSAPPLSVLLSVTLLLQVTVTVVSVEEKDGTNENSSPPSDPRCVPYNLCRNKTANIYGIGIIQTRSQDPCPNTDDVWCYDQIKSPMTQNFDSLIWQIFPPPPSPPPPSDQCKCVPYYLCKNNMIVTNGGGVIDIKSDINGQCPSILEICCDGPTDSSVTEDKDAIFDKKIWEVFQPRTPPPPPCVCVPRQLCRNNTIDTFGGGTIDIKSSGPCDYLDVCCYYPIPSTETLNINYEENRTICGHWNSAGIGFNIIGDSNNEAQFSEFNWVVAILKIENDQSKTYLCGGSLIHPKVVLTAFHCLEKSENPYDLVIRAGEWDLKTENEILPSQNSKILKIIKHEKYQFDGLLNDVALIIVAEPFILRMNVGTICLPSPNAVFDNQRCYSSGWGKNEFGKSGVYQLILKKLNLPVVPRSLCQFLFRTTTRLGIYFKLHESFMCAGGEIGRKDTCTGDGGSPLMCSIENRPKQFHQAGIVAWGIGCGNGTPGAYVDVAFFRKWIDEQMDKENLDKRFYDPDYVPSKN